MLVPARGMVAESVDRVVQVDRLVDLPMANDRPNRLILKRGMGDHLARGNLDRPADPFYVVGQRQPDDMDRVAIARQDDVLSGVGLDLCGVIVLAALIVGAIAAIARAARNTEYECTDCKTMNVVIQMHKLP